MEKEINKKTFESDVGLNSLRQGFLSAKTSLNYGLISEEEFIRLSIDYYRALRREAEKRGVDLTDYPDVPQKEEVAANYVKSNKDAQQRFINEFNKIRNDKDKLFVENNELKEKFAKLSNDNKRLKLIIGKETKALTTFTGKSEKEILSDFCVS